MRGYRGSPARDAGGTGVFSATVSRPISVDSSPLMVKLSHAAAHHDVLFAHSIRMQISQILNILRRVARTEDTLPIKRCFHV